MTEQNHHEPAGEPCIPLSEIRQELARILAAESGVLQIEQTLIDAAGQDGPADRISQGLDTVKIAGSQYTLDEVSKKIVTWLDTKQLDK